MTGRLHHLVYDTRDPRRDAAFWSQLLGWPVTHDSDDFVVVARDDTTSGVAFQLAPGHEPPRWPSSDGSQQAHFDVMVDDLPAGVDAVLALGAARLADTVFADPSGHPFCLIPRPSWAPPVG